MLPAMPDRLHAWGAVVKVKKNNPQKHKQSMRSFGLFFMWVILSGLFTSCGPYERSPFYEADISGITADSVVIRQYEEVLFNLNPFILRQEIEPHLHEFSFFLGERIDDEDGQQQLYDYVTDPFMIDLYIDAREIWPGMQDLENALTEAFRYYRYHFPEDTIPKIYTYISGIDYQMPVIYSDGHLAIALDAYLGSNYKMYGRLGIPVYQSRWMTPERVPADVMHQLAVKHLSRVTPRPETLLEHMVHQGKIMYFLDCMLPHVEDTMKIKYTGTQQTWMKRNAGLAWTYKIENDLLYDTDHGAITKFTGEAPFTSAFSGNSAPRTGAWLGWQMVREFMRRHDDVSLQELIHETDARKILTRSRYRPR